MTEHLRIEQGETFRYEDEDEKALSLILSEKLPRKSYQLKTKQNICKISEKYIGILELPTRVIEITPRFSNIGTKQVQMMYFFVNSRSTDALEYTEVFELKEGPISEKIAKKFVRELSNVIQGGLPHLYTDQEKDSAFVKGRLDLCKTRENICLLKSKPFHCEYSETSMDNPVSRILGASLYKIENTVPDDFVRLARHLPFCTAEEGRRLSDSYVASGREHSYSKALDWARLILYDLQVLSLGYGRFGSSFLTDFDRLFQDFCFRALKIFGEANKLDVNLLVETPRLYYEEIDSPGKEPKKIEPDILYDFDEDSGLAEVVLDSKCKKGVFLTNDVYQMEFYSTCLLAKKGVLMYPKKSEGPGLEVLKIKKELKSVHLKEMYAVFVELTADTYEEFISDMNKFAKTVSNVILNT